MELQLIQSKIYEIRGYKVMLDRDLAEMYAIETKRLKESVNRNRERFEGDDFMFQLTSAEIVVISRSQISTMNKGRGTNFKYAPYVFTELGVAMLSSVLNSKTAIEINRNIMRAFVAVRQLVSNSPVDKISKLHNEIKELKEYIEDVFSDYNDINEDTQVQLELINQALAELQSSKRITDKNRKRIGFIQSDDTTNNL